MLAGNVELRRNSSPSLDKLIADVGQPPAAVMAPDPTNGDASPQQLPLGATSSALQAAARIFVLLTRHLQASRCMRAS